MCRKPCRALTPKPSEHPTYGMTHMECGIHETLLRFIPPTYLPQAVSFLYTYLNEETSHGDVLRKNFSLQVSVTKLARLECGMIGFVIIDVSISDAVSIEIHLLSALTQVPKVCV